MVADASQSEAKSEDPTTWRADLRPGSSRADNPNTGLFIGLSCVYVVGDQSLSFESATVDHAGVPNLDEDLEDTHAASNDGNERGLGRGYARHISCSMSKEERRTSVGKKLVDNHEIENPKELLKAVAHLIQSKITAVENVVLKTKNMRVFNVNVTGDDEGCVVKLQRWPNCDCG